MGQRDLYDILGVKKDASADEIKRAYRRLSKQYHPDRNPDDPKAEEHFKEVQRAYDTLKDEKKRADYDQFGEAGVGNFRTDPTGRRVYEWGGGHTVNVEDLEDLFSAFGTERRSAGPSIFEQFFGQRPAEGRTNRRAATPPQRGADEERTLDLTFMQAVEGATVTVRVRKGDGQAETLEVKVPAGVEDGKKIRLRGRGHAGLGGGPAGDLLLVCRVAPHPYFRREGGNIYLDVPVTASEVALGAKLEVPSLEGMATVSLPAGTPGGTKLRVRGKGGKLPSGGRGDLFLAIRIVPPRTLSDEQRELYESLQKLDTQSPREKLGWPDTVAG